MLRTLPERLIGFAMRHAVIVVLATFAATLVFGWFALKVRINPDFTSLLPVTEKSARILKEYGGDAVVPDILMLAVTADGSGGGLFAPARLAALSDAVTQILAVPGMKSVISPFNLVSFGGQGGHLTIGKMSPGGVAPDPAGIDGFRQRLAAASYAKNLVVSGDGTMLIAYFEVERRADYTGMMREVDPIVARLRTQGLTTYVTGSVPLSARTGFYLTRDFTRLLSLAALIIILCYAVGYRSKRGVILPLLSVLMGTLWTVGFMGMAGYSLSLISIVAPPLILIFGNEYTIYTMSELNRLVPRRRGLGRLDHPRRAQRDEAHRDGLPHDRGGVPQPHRDGRRADTGVRHRRQRRILLLRVPRPGVPARRSAPLLPPPRQRRRRGIRGSDLMSTVMRGLARFAVRFPAVIIAVLALAALLFALTWPKLDFNTDASSYYPQHDRALLDMYAIYGKAGGYQQVSVSFDAPPGHPG